jgi:hypothetical protein
MGFFGWLGSLVDQLFEWLGSVFKVFINALVSALQSLWETVIVSALIAAFGFAVILYVIFYVVNGKTIAEFWDPQKDEETSSFEISGLAPPGTPIPRKSSKPMIITPSYR